MRLVIKVWLNHWIKNFVIYIFISSIWKRKQTKISSIIQNQTLKLKSKSKDLNRKPLNICCKQRKKWTIASKFERKSLIWKSRKSKRISRQRARESSSNWQAQRWYLYNNLEMLKKIREMRTNLLSLKKEQLSTTTRLTILQNHQLTS